MISNLTDMQQKTSMKRKLPTREQLAKMKRILAEIPIRRKMREEQLINQYNFQRNQEIQQLKNERDRIIGMESKLIPSLRYKLPTSTGGQFGNIAKNRMEQLELQYINQMRNVSQLRDLNKY